MELVDHVGIGRIACGQDRAEGGAVEHEGAHVEKAARDQRGQGAQLGRSGAAGLFAHVPRHGIEQHDAHHLHDADHGHAVGQGFVAWVDQGVADVGAECEAEVALGGREGHGADLRATPADPPRQDEHRKSSDGDSEGLDQRRPARGGRDGQLPEADDRDGGKGHDDGEEVDAPAQLDGPALVDPAAPPRDVPRRQTRCREERKTQKTQRPGVHGGL